MRQLTFDQYCFDPDTLRLSRDNQDVALRPKAALILKQLLNNPGEIVAKQTLFEQAWGDRWTADQNLFQAISELRSTFAPLEPILTHPNRGYSWCIATKKPTRRQPHRLQGWAAAAAAAVLITASGTFNTTPAEQDRGLTVSPALAAFNSGLATLAKNPANASEYFALTLRENPQFLEARLMLAQSLLLADEIDKARTEAEHLYVIAMEQELDYLQVSVMGLMSRLDESSGRSAPALEWARSALNKANERGFACAAEDAGRLLDQLLTQHPEAALASNRPTAKPSDQPPLPLAASTHQTLARACDPLLGVSELLPPVLDSMVVG
ncbi:MAG: winged helix-turn-helix domain-containing protein [Lysobacterales bacterium]